MEVGELWTHFNVKQGLQGTDGRGRQASCVPILTISTLSTLRSFSSDALFITLLSCSGGHTHFLPNIPFLPCLAEVSTRSLRSLKAVNDLRLFLYKAVVTADQTCAPCGSSEHCPNGDLLCGKGL